MKRIELIIEEGENPINAISLVTEPAIESDFIFLNKSHNIKLKTVSEEKRIVIGAALIPNKLIYRTEGSQEFEVFFSNETVRKASQLYLKNNRQKAATLNHEEIVSGITVVESWIVEDVKKDKSAIYKLDAPIGTWVISMLIDNNQIWNDYIKTGDVKGFSIEGQFIDKALLSAKNDKDISEELRALIEKVK